MTPTPSDIRALLARRKVKQADLAERVGLHYSLLSMILNERRPMPDGLPERLVAAVDELSPIEVVA